MTTYDDNLLAARFAALAPEPLPDDWDDVLGRAGVARDCRPRLAPSYARDKHPRRRWGLVAVAAVILVGGLLVTPAFGLGERLLELIQGQSAGLREVRTPVWSPDGRTIAFTSIRDGNPEIYAMDSDGRAQRNLTRYPRRDGGPAWSPNGKTIAFERWIARNPDVFVMNADGSGQRNLTSHPAADILPVWSPRGLKVAFVRRISFIGKPLPFQPPGVLRPPGPRILYRNFLDVVNADGSGLRRLTHVPIRGHGSSLAAWSADGRTLRFGPWVVSVDGSGQVRLPLHPPWAGAWSPDGERIAFVRVCRQPAVCGSPLGGPGIRSDLYVMNADGSGSRSVARHVAYSAPVWSPDGRRFAFRSVRDGNPEIYVANADGSGVRRITRHPANERWFSWSTDGARLAFVRNREVYVVRADGSNERKLTQLNH